jgi:hypothetical protein
MEKRTLIAAAVAVLVVAGVITAVMIGTSKHHLVLKGDVMKVRTKGIDNENTIAILDFRLSNPSDVQFIVRDVVVTIDTADGKAMEGDTVAEVDAERLFQYYPVLGQKYNPTLMIRSKVNPGQTLDRMIAVRFPTSEQQVQDRKSLRIRIREVDGTTSEITR